MTYLLHDRAYPLLHDRVFLLLAGVWAALACTAWLRDWRKARARRKELAALAAVAGNPDLPHCGCGAEDCRTCGLCKGTDCPEFRCICQPAAPGPVPVLAAPVPQDTGPVMLDPALWRAASPDATVYDAPSGPLDARPYVDYERTWSTQ
jgi:hypothetical protein